MVKLSKYVGDGKCGTCCCTITNWLHHRIGLLSHNRRNRLLGTIRIQPYFSKPMPILSHLIPSSVPCVGITRFQNPGLVKIGWSWCESMCMLPGVRPVFGVRPEAQVLDLVWCNGARAQVEVTSWRVWHNCCFRAKLFNLPQAAQHQAWIFGLKENFRVSRLKAEEALASNLPLERGEDPAPTRFRSLPYHSTFEKNNNTCLCSRSA